MPRYGRVCSRLRLPTGEQIARDLPSSQFPTIYLWQVSSFEMHAWPHRWPFLHGQSQLDPIRTGIIIAIVIAKMILFIPVLLWATRCNRLFLRRIAAPAF